ncbi:MAG TPA: DUF456 domain-containing protein [Nocardioidaceae bacterium]|nr:DUF456 domain-containing protein [Nocardioidaceae bacterium]
MESEVVTELVVGLVIAVGIVGILVPVLPGTSLVWAAILVWALVTQAGAAWVVLLVATSTIGIAAVVKYLVPHRRLRHAGVPGSSIMLGAALGVVGFFAIPVIGLPVGFVGGIYAAEHHRQRSGRAAWTSTITAMRAVGLAILIELAGAMLAAAAWLVAAVAT